MAKATIKRVHTVRMPTKYPIGKISERGEQLRKTGLKVEPRRAKPYQK